MGRKGKLTASPGRPGPAPEDLGERRECGETPGRSMKSMQRWRAQSRVLLVTPGPPPSAQPGFLPGPGPKAGASQQWGRRENCFILITLGHFPLLADAILRAPESRGYG